MSSQRELRRSASLVRQSTLRQAFMTAILSGSTRALLFAGEPLRASIRLACQNEKKDLEARLVTMQHLNVKHV